MDNEKQTKSGILKLIVALIIGGLIGYVIGIHENLRKTDAPTVIAQEEHVPDITPAAEETITQVEDSTAMEPEAVTILNYELNWHSITLSLRNNLSQQVEGIWGRAVFYDKSGQMIDYCDFNVWERIDAGMTRICEGRVFGDNLNKLYKRKDITTVISITNYTLVE